MTQEEFDNKIWPHLTQEETTQLLCYSMCGAHQYNEDGSLTILMGLKAIQQLDNYKQELIDKYEKVHNR